MTCMACIAVACQLKRILLGGVLVAKRARGDDLSAWSIRARPDTVTAKNLRGREKSKERRGVHRPTLTSRRGAPSLAVAKSCQGS